MLSILFVAFIAIVFTICLLLWRQDRKMAQKEKAVARPHRLVFGVSLLLLLLAGVFFVENLIPLAGWRDRWARQQFLRAHTEWHLTGITFVGGYHHSRHTAVCKDVATIDYINRSLRLTRRGYLFPGGARCRVTFSFQSGEVFTAACSLGSQGMELRDKRWSRSPVCYMVPFKRPLPAPLMAMIAFVGNGAARGTACFGPCSAGRRHTGAQTSR